MRKLFFAPFFLGLFLSCQKQTDFIDGQQSKVNMEIQSDLISISDVKKAALTFINQSQNINKIGKSASNLKKGNNTVTDKTIKDIIQKKSSDNNSSIYIINYENGGFCIMSDSKISQPILAYSDKGHFNPNDPELNSGIKLWLDESLMYVSDQKTFPDSLSSVVNRTEWSGLLAEASSISTYNTNDSQRLAAMNQRMGQLLQASNMNSTVIPLSAASSYLPPERLSHFKSIAQSKGSPEQYTIVEILDKTRTIEVDQLMNTHWFQSGIFGQEVPNGLAGCTATAAGQIMNYYKYPSSFNWNNMTNANIYNNNDVALFMKILGQKFNMDYNSDGSGASIGDVKSGLQSYGYIVTEKDYGYEDVKNSLMQNRPVYLTGCRNTTFLGLIYKDCHAWVAEGYKQYDHDKAYRIEWQTSSYTYNTDGIQYFQAGNNYTYYYVNWGWGSNYNGWFASLHNEGQSGHLYQYRRKNLYITKP